MAKVASRDGNFVPTIIAVSDADGVTIDPIQVNPSTNAILVSDGTGGTDHGTVDAQRDENFVPCWMGVSSTDGVTPVAIYTDGSGRMLVQST